MTSLAQISLFRSRFRVVTNNAPPHKAFALCDDPENGCEGDYAQICLGIYCVQFLSYNM